MTTRPNRPVLTEQSEGIEEAKIQDQSESTQRAMKRYTGEGSRNMKLWTVWRDYYATGEGRTLMAHIGYAKNAQEAIEGFGREFDPYFASGAEALEGVHENEVTQALFAPAAFKRAREIEGHAPLALTTLALTARFHFNFA